MSYNNAIIWAAKVITDKKHKGGIHTGNNRMKLQSSYLDVLGPLHERTGDVAKGLADARRAALKITPEMLKKWEEESKKSNPGRKQ